MSEDSKELYLIRHAKSSWNDPYETDFDRPLNSRGEGDAPEMGRRLKSLGVKPDLVISSTAKRAKQTAKKICKSIGYDVDAIKWVEKLYHCGPVVFEEVLYELDDNISSVFIVAHNPGITMFANSLTHNFFTENMPTCAVVGARFSLKQWTDFSIAEKQVHLYEYPKKSL